MCKVANATHVGGHNHHFQTDFDISLLHEELLCDNGIQPVMSRQLVSILLGLSAVGGLAASGCSADGPAIERSNDPLLHSDAWKHLVNTWTEARDIAAGKRGDYPFDQKEKDKLLKALNACSGDLDQLAAAGLLTADETMLLKQELPRLIAGVQAKRPKEMAMATCYSPMPYPASAKSDIDRLADRLPLLQKLAESGTLHTLAVEKILDSIEQDIAPLSNDNSLKRFPAEEQIKSKALRLKAQQQIEAIRLTLATQDSPQWKTIIAAWREATPLALSGVSTQKQRDHARQALADACKAANELAQAGSLSVAEVALLVAEAARIEKEIYRNPPTDSQVTCYDMMMISPARESLERLSQRLPLLQKLTASGHLNPVVADKVLPAIEADLKNLTSEAEIHLLPPADQAKARNLAKAVAAQLQQIKQFVKQ